MEVDQRTPPPSPTCLIKQRWHPHVLITSDKQSYWLISKFTYLMSRPINSEGYPFIPRPNSFLSPLLSRDPRVSNLPRWFRWWSPATRIVAGGGRPRGEIDRIDPRSKLPGGRHSFRLFDACWFLLFFLNKIQIWSQKVLLGQRVWSLLPSSGLDLNISVYVLDKGGCGLPFLSP
jgi:hypothetical protein